MNFDKETEELKKAIDEDARKTYADERKLNDFQLNEKLMFVTNTLWNTFHDVIDPIRKNIQKLESGILINRYKLEDVLQQHCTEKMAIESVNSELKNVEDNLDHHHSDMREIEHTCNGIDSEGDLRRLPSWVFFVLMGIVGLAEVIVYYNVFLSQEFGGLGGNTPLDRIRRIAFALIMAGGFTIMIIWLSHKLGMLLRQYTSVHQNVKYGYKIKAGVISLVVIAAIISTVVIRSHVHEIDSMETKYEKLDNSYGDSIENDEGEEEEVEDSFFGEATSTKDISKTQTQAISSKKNDLDKLADKITELKSKLAKYFIVINLMIVIAGIFLSYEIHTSSVKYEALESMIARLERRREKLQKKKNKIEKDLMKKEKSNVVNILTQYVESVNTFDGYSQEVKTLKRHIENVYIQMVYYMLGSMKEYNLLSEFDDNYLKQYSPDFLAERFNNEWKLDKIYMEVNEVMHINNIDEFIETFKCSSLKEKSNES